MTDNKLMALIVTAALVFGLGLSPAIWINKPAERVSLEEDGLIPQPQFNQPDTTYGPPYNVRIHCVYTGGPGKLDPDAGPRPGQTYKMVCKSYPWKKPIIGKSKKSGPAA